MTRLSAFLCWTLILATVSVSRADELREVSIKSSQDGTQQPAMVFIPEQKTTPQPLLVVLHTWSGNYRQQSFINTCLSECRKRGWALIHPNFRGPNWTPEACGSDLAVADVLDAVDWMTTQSSIDPDRVYLVGTSGGGHMSMLMAGRAPERWAGVSAWVGISDLVKWHAETQAAGRGYSKHIEKACGGAPGTSAEVDEQYRRRSPLTYLMKARNVPIDLNAGIHDGHTGSVPISHSLHAFNTLAAANGHPEQTFTDRQIEFMTTQEQIPGDLRQQPIEEERKHEILLRRTAGPARITLFEGGHEGDMLAAISWLAQQSRDR